MKNFICPSCGAEYTISEEKHVRCKICKEEIIDLYVKHKKDRSLLPYFLGFLLVSVIFYSAIKKDPVTQLLITVSTDTRKDSGTENNVYLTINDDNNPYLLDKPDKVDRLRGTATSYQFKVDYALENIDKIKLSIKGVNAWRLKEFNIQFISEDQYSAKYVDNKRKWFSEEAHDINTFGAKPSYSYTIDMKSFEYKNVPTLQIVAD